MRYGTAAREEGGGEDGLDGLERAKRPPAEGGEGEEDETPQDGTATQHFQISSSSISSISETSKSWADLTADECMGRTPAAKHRRTEESIEACMDTNV